MKRSTLITTYYGIGYILLDTGKLGCTVMCNSRLSTVQDFLITPCIV